MLHVRQPDGRSTRGGPPEHVRHLTKQANAARVLAELRQILVATPPRLEPPR